MINVMKKFFKLLLKIVVGLLLLILILHLILGRMWEWAAYKPLMKKKFNSEEWKAVQEMKEPQLSKRCGMYHDLTRNHLRKGMTIKEVENLLGAIDDWEYCKNGKIKCAYYGMNVCYSNALSIVPMSLITCFNRKGKLITYDREVHCTMQGSYDLRIKEQYCWRTRPGSDIPFRTNDCGIDPW